MGMRSRRLALPLLALALLSACTSGGSTPAGSSTSASGSMPSSASPPSPPASSSVVGVPALSNTRVSVEPSGTGSFLVHAVYPKSQSNCKHVHTARFRARYPGALSVKSADDGTLDRKSVV